MRKPELKAGIAQHIQKIKGKIALEQVYQITDLLSRKFDTDDYKTLTDEEWSKSSIIFSVMRSSDSKTLRCIEILCSRMS